MSFATVQQVKDLTPKAGTGGITDLQIQGFLDLNTADLVGCIKSRDYSTPTSGTTAFDVLAQMNALYGAYRLQYALWNQTGKMGKCEAADALKADYDQRLGMLRSGIYDYLFSPAVATPTNIAGNVGALGLKEPYVDYADEF